MVPQRQLIPWQEVDLIREARQILEHESTAIKYSAGELDGRFAAAVELIAKCQGNVVVTGIGKAGLIGRKVVSTFCSLGIPSHFLHPTEALHGDLGQLQSRDIVLAFSNSGETDELLAILPIIKSFGLPLIAVTSLGTSSLGRSSSYVIEYGRHQEAGLQGLPPTTTTTIMLAIGDALGLVAAKLRGFTPQNFAKLHPGGSLGRAMTPVSDIMRRNDELRIDNESATVREVFSRRMLPSRRTGAVILVDQEQKIAGLFTDSDLARLLEHHQEEKFDRPIREVMTQRPITIRAETLLSEVVEIFSRKKVSELPVVDEEDKPIGLVDITDVIGLLPVEDL